MAEKKGAKMKMRNKKILGLGFLVLATSSMLCSAQKQYVTVVNETAEPISAKLLFRGKVAVCPPKSFSLAANGADGTDEWYKLPTGCCLEGIEVSGAVSAQVSEESKKARLELSDSFEIEGKHFKDPDGPARRAFRECTVANSVRIAAPQAQRVSYHDREERLYPNFKFVITKKEEGNLKVEAFCHLNFWLNRWVQVLSDDKAGPVHRAELVPDTFVSDYVPLKAKEEKKK